MYKRQVYGNDSISSLKGADRVRKRPAVIFGSDGIEGCQHSIFEILSNSIDEAREGFGNIITVTRYKDFSIEVEDLSLIHILRTVQKSAAEAFQGINKESMSKISLPVVVVGPKNDIVWYNTPFLNKVCAKRECIGESIVQFTSGLPVDQLLNRKGLDVSYQEKRFTVFGMTSHCLLYTSRCV